MFSAETVVEVVGIGDKFEVIDHKLVPNQPGFIEIEVNKCSVFYCSK